MPQCFPRFVSDSANASTSGVLPVPPTVMLPTMMRGTPTECDFSRPARYAPRRIVTSSPNSHEMGRRTSCQGPLRCHSLVSHASMLLNGGDTERELVNRYLLAAFACVVNEILVKPTKRAASMIFTTA